MTDEDIIMRHDPSLRYRARMELKIVNALIARANETGKVLHVVDYEEDGQMDYDVKDALFNLDEATLDVVDVDTFKYQGFIFLVFGNDGYDLISDYSTNLEEFLRPINELADRLEDGVEPLS